VNHIKALGMKYVFVSVAMLMVLGVFNYRISVILTLSAAVTLIAYFIGDLYILPKFGIVTATLADLGLAFVIIWVFNSLFVDNQQHVILASLGSAIFIAGGEIFFHGYLNQRFYNKGERITTDSGKVKVKPTFATEFAEENEIIDVDKKNNNDNK
jgi:hypothetical protein